MIITILFTMNYEKVSFTSNSTLGLVKANLEFANMIFVNRFATQGEIRKSFASMCWRSIACYERSKRFSSDLFRFHLKSQFSLRSLQDKL